MSNQTFTVSQGLYRNLQYCDGQSCTKRVDFDYNLNPGLNDCNPNKGIHGTCTNQFFAYTCNCPLGYSGIQCEVVRGLLRVFIQHGHGLPNKDYYDASGPYATVEAYNHKGNYKSLQTRIEYDGSMRTAGLNYLLLSLMMMAIVEVHFQIQAPIISPHMTVRCT